MRVSEFSGLGFLSWQLFGLVGSLASWKICSFEVETQYVSTYQARLGVAWGYIF